VRAATGSHAAVWRRSSPLARDLDPLTALAELPGTRVNFTITTLDRALWRAIEPGTPPPAQRFAVMRRLTAAGIPCGVYLAPVLPGLTDGEEAIAAIAEMARDHGASAFWAGPLRLAPLVKEHYFGFVAQTFPELLPRYSRAYPGPNAPLAYRAMLDERIARVRLRYGFGEGNAKEPAGLDSPRAAQEMCALGERTGQLSLPL
jgi:DNA repair photolyase